MRCTKNKIKCKNLELRVLKMAVDGSGIDCKTKCENCKRKAAPPNWGFWIDLPHFRSRGLPCECPGGSWRDILLDLVMLSSWAELACQLYWAPIWLQAGNAWQRIVIPSAQGRRASRANSLFWPLPVGGANNIVIRCCRGRGLGSGSFESVWQEERLGWINRDGVK